MMQNIEDYQFIQELKNLKFIEKIYLYGSRAKGNNSERSDIDLAISCPQATDLEWLQVSEIIENADTLLKIDFLRLDEIRETNKIKENILREGIIL
ncbi:MAG: nucleotidyltransferase domain-containing protein [Candidatus Caenarcaniphilales bacterium]|nr:nucleotidyltransferase domain-containing protein [Candidatus Caenarcaniphilales bacterium]